MSNWAFHAALFAALNEIGDWAVYDAVTGDAEFPYVVLDAQQAVDEQLLASPRERVRVYLSVWSRVRGQEEVLKIMRAVKDALQNSRLALSTGRVVSLTVTQTRTQKDIQDETHTGLMTLEARLVPGLLAAPVISLSSPYLTNDATPGIPGTAPSLATVDIYRGGVLAGTATADQEGAWLYTFAALASGSYQISARIRDAAGNRSAFSAALALTVDTVAPAAPVISTASPFVTTDTTPAIAGTAEANATVTVYLDGVASGEPVSADGAGAWAFTFGPLDIDSYSVTARATDAAGNTSAASAALTLTINPALAIEGTPVTEAVVGTAYEWSGTVSGGVKPYTPSILNAPAGMQVEMTGEDTYRVFGPITAGGTFSGIVVQAEDSE